METIKATCYTNLDNYDCTITNVFSAIPRIGDRVRVLYKGNVCALKVCGITHQQSGNEPYITIELHH